MVIRRPSQRAIVPVEFQNEEAILMPRKPKPDDAEQSKRFIETAEEVGADESDTVQSFLKKTPRRDKAIEHPTSDKDRS